MFWCSTFCGVGFYNVYSTVSWAALCSLLWFTELCLMDAQVVRVGNFRCCFLNPDKCSEEVLSGRASREAENAAVDQLLKLCVPVWCPEGLFESELLYRNSCRTQEGVSGWEAEINTAGLFNMHHENLWGWSGFHNSYCERKALCVFSETLCMFNKSSVCMIWLLAGFEPPTLNSKLLLRVRTFHLECCTVFSWRKLNI